MFRHASLNRIYRLVWSEARGAFVAVAENARARGKRSHAVGALAIVGAAFTGSYVFAAPPTTVVPTGGNTRAYISANGVPVVDINTANAAGVSHNQYSKYNVDSKGLVLNNGNSSQMARQSQLAGQVMANTNLADPANLILNEVIAPNRSLLAGFTEVLGSKADVVVANPYGITCSGCGFINTDRATLTTGTPVFGANGALNGFDVTRGDLLVTGNGLNGSAQQILDLVARAITVDGQINARDLSVTAGANQWNYAARAATGATAPADSAPAYALDSTVLGGMYANRIKIVATDAGVGVRMLNEAAATTGDFTLDASGRVVVQGRLSAARDLQIATSSNAADALTLNDSRLTAQNNLALAAQAGGIALNGGALVANNDIALDAATLSDAATATALDDNNKRYAGGAMQLRTSGAAQLNGVNYGSGGAFAAQVGNFSVGANGATLYSDGDLTLDAAQNIALANAALQAGDTLQLSAQSGSVTTGNGANQGIKSGGDVVIEAATLDNAGSVDAAGDAQIAIGTLLNNDGTLFSAGDFTVRGLATPGYDIANAGRIEAGGLLDINADASRAVDLTVGSSGVVRAQSMQVNAAALTVAGDDDAGGIVNSTGAMNLDLNTLTLAGSRSRIVAASDGNAAADIVLGSHFTNQGAIYSGGDLTLELPSLQNAANAGIAAAGTLQFNIDNGALLNEGALYAGTQFNAGSDAQRLASFINAATGTLDSNGAIAIYAGTFTNNHAVVALGDITITAAQFHNDYAGNLTRQWGAETIGPAVEYNRSVYMTDGCFLPFCLAENIYYSRERVRVEEFVGNPNLDGDKPQILSIGSNGTITVRQFDSGSNKGGVISAPNVTLSGNAGSQFVNDSLALRTETSTERWYQNIDHTTVGDIDYGNFPLGTTVATTTHRSAGAGIYANAGQLAVTNAALTNNGDVGAAASALRTSDPRAGAVTDQSESAANGFDGLNLTLPSNPNGLFVPVRNPRSRYLIETNPLYALGSSFLGSDYLFEQLGYDPEVINKRLGDANYEAYLLRQQLLQQIGTNLIKGYASEAAQMRDLMDNAAVEAKRLGLAFGTAPTSAQLAGLREDVVWMVETEVAGEKVLAPVVYLAPATKVSYESGAAIIAGSTVNMNVAALTNIGGTIVSDARLDITAQGDITNISGTVKGGDVALKSTQGDITSRTYTSTRGDALATTTEVGKQAVIESSGNLQVDAAGDVSNLGAKMAAGKDAAISAGGDVTFDTVEKKTIATEHGVTGSPLAATVTQSTTRTTEQIKSELSAGGKLSVTSKDDVTFAGTDVKAGGDAAIDAGGDVNLTARSNTLDRTSTSSTTGLGVGGGLFGSEKIDTDEQHKRNVGSTLDVGGNAQIKAGKDLTLEGSQATIEGDAAISATDINVIAGKDTDHSTTTRTTTTFLKADSQNQAAAGADATASASAKKLQATAGAEAKAEASSENTLTLMSTETATTESLAIKNKQSAITSGGAMSIEAKDRLTTEGSSLESGGDMALQAKDMTFKAAEDIESTTTTSNKTSVALYNENKASAKAAANASAGVGTSPLKASAEAGAEVSSETGLKVENTQSTTASGSTTAVVSSIKAGGDMKRTASGKITDVGTQIEAGGDFAQSANEIDSQAAKNTTYSSSSSTTNTGKIGAYAEAGAKANGGTGEQPKAEANAGFGGHIGYENKQETSTSNTSQAVVSTIKAGGNVSSSSQQKTSLEGTRITSGKDTALEAGSLDYKAAQDSASSTSSSSSIKADVKGGMNYGTDGAAKGELSGGYATQKSSESSTTAVTGGIDSGGKLTIKTREDARFEGAQLKSAGDAAIDAGGDVKFDAAKNTQSKSAQGFDVSGSVSASKSKEGEKEGALQLEGGYNKSSSAASQAVTGGVDAGGKVNISAGKSATFEGTGIASGGDTAISAADNVTFKAARDTSSSESINARGSLSASASSGPSKAEGQGKSATPAATTDSAAKPADSASKKADGGEGTQSTTKGAVNVGADYAKESSSTAKVGSIASGGDISVSAGKTATLEGTQVAAKGVAAVEGAQVDINAAQSTSDSFSVGGAIGVKATNTQERDAAGKETKNETIGRSGVSATIGGDSDTTSTAASITSGAEPKTPTPPENRTLVTLTNNTFKTSVAIPANLPAGKRVEAVTADGKPLPAWLSFDAKTGTFVGTPPADFKGDLNVVVKVPTASGGVTEIPLRFQAP